MKKFISMLISNIWTGFLLLVIYLGAIAGLIVLEGTINKAFGSEFAVELHGVSKHLEVEGLNEVNYGVGLVYYDGQGTRYSIGKYRNSFDEQSEYISAGPMLKLNKYVSAGVEGGLVNGYEDGVRPFLLPVVNVGPMRIRWMPYPANVFTLSVEVPLVSR